MVNFVMWVITWGIVGWLVGILGFFVGGILVAPFVSPEKVNSIASWYDKIAIKISGLSGIMDRGSKFDILSGTHKSGLNADEYKLDDKIIHVTNETGLRSTMHTEPFGLIAPPEDDRSTYVSPELAEFGEFEARREENGTLTDETGQYIDEITLPEVRPLVQLQDFAARLVPGTRSMQDLDETIDLYQQSQSLFGQSKVEDLLVFLGGYVVGSILIWIIMTNAGGTIPDTSIGVPSLGILLPVIP